MTAPETGSMADHDRLAEALTQWRDCHGFTDMFRLEDCARRCGMPTKTPSGQAVVDWAARRLATYRAMMERG